jgi:hypothetical protein
MWNESRTKLADRRLPARRTSEGAPRASAFSAPLRYPYRAVTVAAPSAETPTEPACRSDQRRLHLRHQSQIPELPRSVDYGGLMKDLTPFEINTSKKSCHSRIALIARDFKPTRINTSAISPFKPPRINTSKKHGGGQAVHHSRASVISILGWTKVLRRRPEPVPTNQEVPYRSNSPRTKSARDSRLPTTRKREPSTKTSAGRGRAL